jgi:hypothetical protein
VFDGHRTHRIHPICAVAVIRGKSGNAEVHVTPPGGFERVLIFIGSKVTAGDAKVKASKSGDT